MIPSEQLPQTDHTMTEPTAEPVKDPSIAAGHSRRTFLFKLALAVNGVVGVVLAIPIVGYLLGPRVEKDLRRQLLDQPRARSRTSLKAKPASSAIATPSPLIGTARPATSPPGSVASPATPSRSSPSTALTSAAPSAGSPSPNSSSAPATVAPTTPTAPAPPVHPNAASSSTSTKSRTAPS